MNHWLYPIQSPPFQTQTTTGTAAPMAWNRSWSRNSWSDSSWQGDNNPDWNNWGRQQAPSQPVQPSVPVSPVVIPHPDHECHDTSVMSGRKFYRNIQSTPWSSKSGLAGKDAGHLRVVDLTEKGLEDYALRNLSNGEFQSVVFVRSVSEAVFTTNLLRLIRQDHLDIDGMAAHMHGAAPPDKHIESLLDSWSPCSAKFCERSKASFRWLSPQSMSMRN